MLSVLEVLKDQEEFEKQLAKEQNRRPNVYHGLFSTHPKNDDRLEEVTKVAAQLASGDYQHEDAEVFLRRLDGLVFGSSEKEGVVRNSRFYHRDLGITLEFPGEWLISNRRTYVLARNKADTSFIVFTAEDLNRKEDPKQFLMRELGEKELPGKPLSNAKLRGYTAKAKIKTPYGMRDGRIGALFFGKRVYVFRAASRTDEEFAGNDALFLKTMNSLRPLEENERELAKPVQIKLQRVKPGDTFASLAARSGFSHHAEEQLRILNGMYPEGEPVPGQLIKTVR